MSARFEIGVRIVDIDYELCKPIDNLDICLSAYSGNALSSVPIIRIFGIMNNHSHDTCCLHIHRVFPYLLIPFHPTNKHMINDMNAEDINLYLTSLAQQIETIIGSLNNKKRKELFYNLCIVYGKDFYGYHAHKEPFIKLSLIDPKDVKRVTMILLSGVINECIYPVFESHIPYLLHFFIDYNLYGMNYIYFSNPSFRQPLPSITRSDLHIPMHLLSSKQIQRKSLCSYEIDIISPNILNNIRNNNSNDNVAMVPSLNAIWQWEKNRRHEMGLAVSSNLTALFSPTKRRIVEDIPLTRIEKRYKNVLETVLQRYKEKHPFIQYQQDEDEEDDGHTMFADDIESVAIESSRMSQLNRSRLYSMSQPQTIDTSILTQNDEDMLDILDDLENNTPSERSPHKQLEIESDGDGSELSFESFVWTDSDSDAPINQTENTQRGRTQSPSLSVLQSAKKERKIEKEIFDIIATQKEFEHEIADGGTKRKSNDKEEMDCDDDEDSLMFEFASSPDIEDIVPDTIQKKEFIIPQYDGGDGNISGSSDGDTKRERPSLRLHQTHRSKRHKRRPHTALRGSIGEMCKVPLFERKKRRKRSYIKSIDVQSNKPKRNMDKHKQNMDTDDNDSNEDMEEIEVSPVKHVRFALTEPRKNTHKRHDLIADKYEFKKPSFMLSQPKRDAKNALTLVEAKRTKSRKRKHVQIETNIEDGTRKKRRIMEIDHATQQSEQQSEQQTPSIKSILRNKCFLDCSVSPIPTNSATPVIRKQLTFSQPNDDLEDEMMNLTVNSNTSSVYLSVGNMMNKILTPKPTQLDLLSISEDEDDGSDQELRFEYRQGKDECVVQLRSKAPSIKALFGNICDYGEVEIEHKAIHFSKEKDVNDGARKNANIVGLGVAPKPPNIPKYLNEFEHDTHITKVTNEMKMKHGGGIDIANESIVEYAVSPPSYAQTMQWLQSQDESSKSPSISSQNSVFSSPIKRKYKTPLQTKHKKPSYIFTQTQTQKHEQKEDTTHEHSAAAYIINCCDMATKDDIMDATSVFMGIDKYKMKPDVHAHDRDESTESHTNQYLTVLSVEILCANRKQLVPDPKWDAILAIAVVIATDDVITNQFLLLHNSPLHHELLTKNGSIGLKSLCQEVDGGNNTQILSFDTELKLLRGFTGAVRFYDADILIGWEIQKQSIGYIIDRAIHLNITDITSDLGRIIKSKTGKPHQQQQGKAHKDEWGQKKASGIHITGRILLNLWRCCRSEIKLNSYTKENVAHHLLNERIARIPFTCINKWYKSYYTSEYYHFAVILRHILRLSAINFDIVSDIDLIGRTSEMSRVIGIDFFSVLSRGSQYRVESLLLRIAKPSGFVMISPSRDQVANQNAMECIALVMEPRSLIYTDPLIVLDFQSLYPSIMIAYNICYSTCLGAIRDPLPTKLGVKHDYRLNWNDLITQHNISPNDIWISPNGIMFVKPHIRKGILNRMVQELLDTRIMTKKTMQNIDKNNEEKLYKLLNARQYSLKLTCNVTYGYTAAGFSGRMPCAEIADTIVETARETLERTIHVIESNKEWKGAKVIYGATDSVFVLLKGASLADSFRIGRQIASFVTAINPSPIKLKFEKVYCPSMLLAKNRYVGLMYEHNEEEEPVIDAKGIEVIRRDSCPLVQNTMRNVIDILFKTRDVSEVKRYLMDDVWRRIMQNKVALSEYIFNKEVRLGSYKNKPPAAIVAERKLMLDSRAYPLYAERVPYLVIYASPGARLVDMVMDPLLFMQQQQHCINALYYITRQINPAVGRILELIQIDVKRWFNQMNKAKVKRRQIDIEMDTKKKKFLTLDSFYLSKHCLICDGTTKHKYFCIDCRSDTQRLSYWIAANKCKMEHKLTHAKQICRKCICGNDRININQNHKHLQLSCVSLDCPVLFQANTIYKDYDFWFKINKIIELK
eukprot:1038821_1